MQSSINVSSLPDSDAGGYLANEFTIAFLVEWGDCSTGDLLTTVRYIERSIEVAKNTHRLGSIRLLIADRNDTRLEPVAGDRLAELTPLVSHCEIVACPLDQPAHSFNRLSKRAKEQIFVILRAGVVISPTLLAGFLTLFRQPDVSIIGARQLPLSDIRAVDAASGFASYADLTKCGAIRSSLFHELSGFRDEHFGAFMFAVDFSWRARLAGSKILFDPALTYFFEENAIKESNSDLSIRERALLIHVWGKPEQLQEFLDRCAEIGRTNATRHVLHLRRLNALPHAIESAETVANFLVFSPLQKS